MRAALGYVLLIALARGILFAVASWMTASPDLPLARYVGDVLVATDVLTFALVPLAFLAWLLWVGWTSRLEENVRALGAGAGAIGPRGAIFWWLVPIANLVVPFGVVSSIDRRLTRDQRPNDLLIAAWWVVFLIAAASVSATSALLAFPASSSEVRADEFVVIAMGSLLVSIAALVAMRVVRAVQGDEDHLADAVLPDTASAVAYVMPDGSVVRGAPSGPYGPGLPDAASAQYGFGHSGVPPVPTVPPVPPVPFYTPGPSAAPQGPYGPAGPNVAGMAPGMPPGYPAGYPAGYAPLQMPPAQMAPAQMPPTQLPPAQLPPPGAYFMPDGTQAAYPPPPPPVIPAPAAGPMPAPAPRRARRGVSWMLVAAIVALGIAVVAGALIPLDDLGTGSGTPAPSLPTAVAVASPSASARPSATANGVSASPSASSVVLGSSRPSASPSGSSVRPSRSPGGASPSDAQPSGASPSGGSQSPSNSGAPSIRPSPGVNPSPSNEPSPSAKPSPSPSLGAAAAGIQLLLQHRTAGDGPCVAAPSVSQPAGATASIVCQPLSTDVETLSYAVYATPDQAQQVVETARTNARVPADSGNCFSGTAGENAYKTNGSPRGRVLCYTSGTGTDKLAHVVWYNGTLSVVGQATAPAAAFKALCEWWATQSGPA